MNLTSNICPVLDGAILTAPRKEQEEGTRGSLG